ncbi:MAG: DEAD/DEAH box helicase [Nitrospirae bacterium]|nr:DEAD/DEAH box helicase [Nitrospirota bacterium]
MNSIIYDNALLNLLNGLSSDIIYSLSSKSKVIVGFKLYEDGRVRDITWNEEETALAVDILSYPPITVGIYEDDGIMRFECDCDKWDEHNNCEHVVCSLVTIKNLLNPKSFQSRTGNKNKDSEKKDRLLQILLGLIDKEAAAAEKISPEKVPSNKMPSKESPPKKKDDEYAIVLEYGKYSPAMYLTLNAAKVQGYSLPKGTPKLLRKYFPFGAIDISSLYEYLLNHGNAYPIYFKDAAKSKDNDYDYAANTSNDTDNDTANNTADDKETLTKITFDKNVEYKTYTGFEINGNVVSINMVCSTDINEVKDLVVIRDYVINKATNIFGRITSKDGLVYWRKIKSTYYASHRMDLYEESDYFYSMSDSAEFDGVPDGSVEADYYNDYEFRMPLEVFQNFQIRVASTQKDDPDFGMYLFRSNGSAVELVDAPSAAYRISATETADEYILDTEVVIGDIVTAPSIYPFDFFYMKMPHGLSTLKKRSILYDVFIGVLKEKTKKGKNDLIKDIISDYAFGQDKHVKEARKMLKRYVNMPLEEFRIYCHNGSWMSIPIDMAKELPTYSIPYELFGPKIFEDMDLQNLMAVDRNDFLSKLPVLIARLKENGIDFFIDGKPVSLTIWDFEFNVTRGAIDWFEIKPEIKYEGKSIDKKLWKQALSGMVKQDDVTYILDETTIKNLSAVMNFFKAEQKKKIVEIPRLQIFDLLALRNLQFKVVLPDEDEAMIQRLLNFRGIEEKLLPVGLKAKLRHYQREGYDWLAFLYENRFGACLADDMGLGKTVQTIVLLSGLKEGIIGNGSSSTVSLVVVPPSLLFNWENELHRFYPNLKVCLYRGKDRSLDFGDCDIVLTSYALVRIDIDKLKELRFNVIVFDEAQALKNIYADTTGAARKLNGYFKLGLTGTPLENHIGEYYSIMDLLLPGLLGEYREFKRITDTGILETVIPKTRPFLLRRTKEKILKELPPKIENDVYLSLTEKQKALYNKTVDEVKKTVEDAYNTKNEGQAKIIALTALLRLRQVCLSIRLLLPDHKDISPKIEFLQEKVDELTTEGHSCLVFSQFTKFLDLIEGNLTKSGYKFYRLDGSTPVPKRKEIVEEFQNSKEPSIFLLSLKAGGQGLNLTKATYVFHMDPWWNPAVENQASDRTHRIGQKSSVIITRLLMKHTVEEKIMHLKKQKSRLYDAIMDPTTIVDSLILTKDDFDYILTSVK